MIRPKKNNLVARALPLSFYMREDVVLISRELLGKYLVSNIGGRTTTGRIVETEAYRGPDDKASHAYNNRFTERTKVMYEEGGVAYVYLCYGIHYLFNVVTAGKGVPHAVLIRALEPVDNVTLMLQRRSFRSPRPQLTAGPGVLTKALGICGDHNGLSLLSSRGPVWIEDRGEHIDADQIIAGPRVGVAYAEECAAWEWRFRIKDSPWTSK